MSKKSKTSDAKKTPKPSPNTEDVFIKAEPPLTLLQKVDALDKVCSDTIHRVTSKTLEAGLLFFAILFNPPPILIMIVLLGTVVISYDR